jgi:hypothetical protein
MEGESRPKIRPKGVVDGHIKKPKRKFILSPTIEVIGFFVVKITINKDAKSIGGKKRINHGKSKEIKVEKSKVAKEVEEVCNSFKVLFNLFEELQNLSCT